MKGLRIHLLFFIIFFTLLIPVFTSEASLFGISSYPDNLNNGLVAWWRFDGKDFNWATGTITDASGNGKNGNIVGMGTTTSLVAGKVGQALKFSTDLTGFQAQNITGMDTYSYSFFAYPIGAGSADGTIFTQIVAAANRCHLVQLYAGNQIKIGGQTGGSLAISADMNKWAHYVIANDSANSVVSIYKNGNFIASSTSPTCSQSYANFMQFGYQNATRNYIGYLDDVRIYNRVLTAAEIKQLSNVGQGNRSSSLKVASSSTDITRGLIGYWPFDGNDISDKVYDRSCGPTCTTGNNGYFIGGATSSAKSLGKIGQGIRLDGVNDTIETTVAPFAFEKTDPFSFAVWFKYLPRTHGNAVSFLGNGDAANAFAGYYFGFQAGGMCSNFNTIGIILWRNNTYLGACSPVNMSLVNGQWHHASMSYDGSQNANGIKIYIDGVPQTTTIPQNNPPTSLVSTKKMRIGDDQTNDWFNGYLDDVRVYNRVISPEEVKKIYNLGSSVMNSSSKDQSVGINTGLVGYYTFDGKDVTDKVYDRSCGPNCTTGYNGYYVGNATSSRKVIGKIGQTFTFDGVDDFVLIPSSYNLGGSSFSVSSWVYRDNATNLLKFISKWNDNNNNKQFDMMISGGNVWFEVMQTNSSSKYFHGNIPLSVGKWYHIVAVADTSNSTLSVYVNGVADTYKSLPGWDGTVKSFDMEMNIGRKASQNAYFAGKVDDVRVYNRALSAEDVKKLYNMGR